MVAETLAHHAIKEEHKRCRALQYIRGSHIQVKKKKELKDKKAHRSINDLRGWRMRSQAYSMYIHGEDHEVDMNNRANYSTKHGIVIFKGTGCASSGLNKGHGKTARNPTYRKLQLFLTINMEVSVIHTRMSGQGLKKVKKARILGKGICYTVKAGQKLTIGHYWSGYSGTTHTLTPPGEINSGILKRHGSDAEGKPYRPVSLYS
ncbi:unnamed protein product [Sphenostylis stenocarpa]|uniref:Uncharacterized protein n=1 Tax=Sphenostylis stenocarpa TaxID=92480 RepID=A0AA86W1K5_9FABA|nr:unnamed protein product [Sphenostylis stenocarpa]